MTPHDADLPLKGRFLLLGVCGSIAAYKAAALVRLCTLAGADVQVLMTPAATRFVAPLTFGTLSGREPLIEVFPGDTPETWTQHVSLGISADLFVIAPATAQTLAKLAHGFSDSMLTATALSARCPILVCPAMDHDMALHAAVAANMDRLEEYGYSILPPEHGPLASGQVGSGRLPEPEKILTTILELLPAKSPGSLSHLRALVTAGPTREPIDPIRVLTNHSTGMMGYALATALRARGADVTLVSGPTSLQTPPGITRIDVSTAEEMHRAVQAHEDDDIVFMAAAVADYTPRAPADHKLKKQDSEMVLHLRPTPDILAGLGARKRPGQLLVGFAMETTDGLASARQKLESKNLDYVVLNNVTEDGAGFGLETNRVTILGHKGSVDQLPLMPKRAVAEALLERIFGDS